MDYFSNITQNTFHLLLESSVYVIFGLIISGLMRIFLSPASVAKHLGKGRFISVFKAAFLGIPLPLCSCGVLPAAVSLKKQGANNGATAAFLISTPESGIDSIAITYALLDPVMTIARPIVAFFSAITAGISENLFHKQNDQERVHPNLICPIDGCCDGQDCSPKEHRRHHSFLEKIKTGLIYAFTDVWGDIASWFAVGLLLAGMITTFIPDEAISRYLGGGLPSMLIMLAVGIPLYICATASTPIAAALILKGVSPGAALVFLLAGPATNVTSITVLLGILGKRATAIYLTTIALSAVMFGLILDQFYALSGLSAKAVVGQAAEFMPYWAKWTGAVILLLLSAKPIFRSIQAGFKSKVTGRHAGLNKSISPDPFNTITCDSPNCSCSLDPVHK